MSISQELRREAALRVDSKNVLAKVLDQLILVEKKVVDRIVGAGKVHDTAYGQAMQHYVSARQNEHRAKRRYNRCVDDFGHGYHTIMNPIDFSPTIIDYEKVLDDAKAVSMQRKQTALAKLQEL